jgi:hypothetical protein
VTAEERFDYDRPPVRGRPIRAPQGGADLSTALTFGVALLGALILLLARVTVFVTGRVVVLDEEQVDARPVRSGQVRVLATRIGQRVQQGQVIARLDPGGLTPQLEGIEREWELLLAKWMRDGSNEALRDRLAELRAVRDRLRADLDEHLLRAPASGTISALWVREGSEVTSGERLASISRDDRRRFVAHLILPAHALGHIRPGQGFRASLDGFPQLYQDHTLSWVAEEAVSALDAKRFFGPERAGFFPDDGAVLLARASLPGLTFQDHDRQLPYSSGMSGRAFVYTRSERLIFVLAPSLHRLKVFR